MMSSLSTLPPLSTITDDAPYRRGDGVDLGADVDLGDSVGDDVDLGDGVRDGDEDDLDIITPKIGMEFATQEDAYNFYNGFLTSKLAEYDVPSQGLNHQVDPTAPPQSQNSSSLISEINIRDPTTSLRHKGRPRLPSRLPSGLELSQEEATKKRKTCGFCGEKGHYRTGCSKAKANNIVSSGQSDPAGSQALPRTQ